MPNNKLHIKETKCPQIKNSNVITAQAYEYALRLIDTNYPGMSQERKHVQAVRLAEKICKREKH